MGEHTDPRYDVFISYSHRDTDVVVALDTTLRLNGLRVFLDTRDITLGDRLVEAVFDGIATARAQLVVLSESSIASNWVRDELAAGRTRAIEGDFRVIPILVDRCTVPAALAHLKYLDLRDWLTDRSFRHGMSELLASLGVPAYATRDPELVWVIRNATVLHQLQVEFTTALGEVTGGLAERLEFGRGTGGTASKWVLNDTRLAASLLQDEGVPWPAELRNRAEAAHITASGCFAGGLVLIQTWLSHAAEPPPGAAVALLRETVDACAEYLASRGIHPWDRVISTQAREASEELRTEIRRICETLSHLTDALTRIALPFPAPPATD